MAVLPTTGGGRIYVYTISASSTAPPSFGVGVKNIGGSNEVFSPRVGGILSVADNSAIVLLDSILTTETAVATSASSFNQLVDASTSTAFNSQITTKSFDFGVPSDLKAFKSFLFSYTANAKVSAGDPVSVRYAESLEPVVNYLATAYSSAPATSGTKTSSKRIALLPRPIDTGIAFGVSTNYVASDSTVGSGQFRWYEFLLSAVGLRKGRTVQ